MTPAVVTLVMLLSSFGQTCGAIDPAANTVAWTESHSAGPETIMTTYQDRGDGLEWTGSGIPAPVQDAVEHWPTISTSIRVACW